MQKKVEDFKIVLGADGDYERTIVTKLAKKLHKESDKLVDFFYNVIAKNWCSNRFDKRIGLTKEMLNDFDIKELAKLTEIYIVPSEYNKTFYVSYKCALLADIKDGKPVYWLNQKIDSSLDSVYFLGPDGRYLDKEYATECWQDFLIEVLGKDYKDVLIKRLKQEIKQDREGHERNLVRIKTELLRYQEELTTRENLIKSVNEREEKLKKRFGDDYKKCR